MKMLITGRTELDLSLPDGVLAVPFRESRPVPDEHLDAAAVVAWGADPSLESMAHDMPNLRWVQSLSAGVDMFVAAGLPDRVVLTSGRGLHDRTVGEHALALILTLLREMPELLEAQRERRWATEYRGPRPMQEPDRVSSLIGARVTIWGFGSIGQHLAGLLAAMGAKVRGVARSAGPRAGFDVVTEDDLDAELAATDILVMVLPATAETGGALDARRLALLPSRAVVINVGRGTTVDEPALVDALEAGRLAGAGLDVTAQEPLPPESELWMAPRTVITPHVGGFRADGGAQLVEHNLRALLEGGEMRNVVER